MKKALPYIVVALALVSLAATSAAWGQLPVPSRYQTAQSVAGEAWAESDTGPTEVPTPPPVASPGNQPRATSPTTAPHAASSPTIQPAGPTVMEDGVMDSAPWDPAVVGPCCYECGGGCRVPPDWYVEQGARFLGRSRPRDLAIGSEFENELNTNLGAERLNSRSASPDLSAMWYMTVGHYFAHDCSDRDHFVEFTFYGLNNWTDDASYAGQRISDGAGGTQGDLYSGFSTIQGFTLVTDLNTFQFGPRLTGAPPINGFDRADFQSTYYSSSMNNYEINGRITPRGRPDRLVLYPNGKWRRECQPGMQMSYLYGVRFLQLNESFRFHSESRISPAAGPEEIYTGDYDVVAHNNLLGIQVGAEMMFRQCRWAWGIRSKVGPYINFADQISDISAGPALAPTWVRRLAYGKHEASLIGEVGFQATYKFRPNLMGRASYDFMWVPGVALAPEQLQFTTEPVNKLNTNGLAFFHGVSFGLEWLW